MSHHAVLALVVCLVAACSASHTNPTDLTGDPAGADPTGDPAGAHPTDPGGTDPAAPAVEPGVLLAECAEDDVTEPWTPEGALEEPFVGSLSGTFTYVGTHDGLLELADAYGATVEIRSRLTEDELAQLEPGDELHISTSSVGMTIQRSGDAAPIFAHFGFGDLTTALGRGRPVAIPGGLTLEFLMRCDHFESHHGAECPPVIMERFDVRIGDGSALAVGVHEVVIGGFRYRVRVGEIAQRAADREVSPCADAWPPRVDFDIALAGPA
jgi:hypothetical protein